MHISPKHLQKFILSSVFVFTIAPIFPTAAQITPDNTLGTERSRLDSNVLINSVLGDKINGGAIRDRNLFHSFSDINVNTGSIRLDNKSAIASLTNSGNGGNIFLDINDFLVLRNSSNISTTAGLQQFGGDGGNITINIPFIIAAPGENSNIAANAFTGKGGQINITTQGIFGIEPRTQASDATKDIRELHRKKCPMSF
ncbi:S-layer family protein [Brunnivagina elsteri]|uniref:Filamentous haemagglutinin FhaB/tRNA nuclease CdiA-like TPS domain-containing protein n=1 Tax=Brunnivagina elsteri CCALA 953 TaxID=987040 RepID=A0A2A2TCJ7_9CYAN|nr:S-layer family protein [Calothrix elsteri]PAX51442.1 hypothetical protein CK510_24745 [Calothrix elsteri CCALA 953]